MRVFIMYFLLIPCVTLFIYVKHRSESDAPLMVGLKAACTTIIALAAVMWTAEAPEQIRGYAVLITSGLVLGLVGDIVICLKDTPGFLAGMIYFALGHLCYIAAFLKISTRGALAIPIFLIIYLLLLYIVGRLKISLGKMMLPTAAYAAVITGMVSLSATVFLSVKGGWIHLVAALLFAASDGILAYGKYGKTKSSALGTFGLYCYFIGQSLFAVSIYCMGRV